MAWFKKKQSPIDQRIQQLNRQIAALEEQARRQGVEDARRRMDPQIARESNGRDEPVASPGQEEVPAPKNTAGPRFRTTVTPKGVSPVHGIEPHEVDFFARPNKSVDFGPDSGPGSKGGKPNKGTAEPIQPARHNVIDDILNFFHKPKTPREKDRLAYLTTGSFQTLKPLRYEKRVARNRLIILLLILAVVVFLLLKCVTRT
jgi:hypothetical protein